MMKLKDDEAVRCPECGKDVGVKVFDKIMNMKALGAIPCYHYKYDYRKSSHIGFGRGFICRKCAKGYFPEGVAYKVTVNYHGKRITPYIGINHSGLFASRKEAYYAVRDMNNRSADNFAKYEEIKI